MGEEREIVEEVDGVEYTDTTNDDYDYEYDNGGRDVLEELCTDEEVLCDEGEEYTYNTDITVGGGD